MKILSIRHNWPENPPFLIDRPNGCPEYVLLHFITPLLLLHDGKKQMIPAGSCIIYSPGHPQWFFSDKPILHDWMHLEGNIPEMMASVGLAPDTLYTPQESHILTELTAELESEFFAERAYKELFSDAKLQEWFIQLGRKIHRNNIPMPNYPFADAFRKLRIEMFSHLNRNWTVSEMAECVRLSESRFFAVYKNMFGISPYNDLLLARMEKARYLLSVGRYTNAEIATTVGYPNEFQFIRHFKKAMGVSPQAYARSRR